MRGRVCSEVPAPAPAGEVRLCSSLALNTTRSCRVPTSRRRLCFNQNAQCLGDPTLDQKTERSTFGDRATVPLLQLGVKTTKQPGRNR